MKRSIVVVVNEEEGASLEGGFLDGVDQVQGDSRVQNVAV